MPALAHKIGRLLSSGDVAIIDHRYQGLYSFVPTAGPFSLCHRVTSRPLLANNAIMRNLHLVRLIDLHVSLC